MRTPGIAAVIVAALLSFASCVPKKSSDCGSGHTLKKLKPHNNPRVQHSPGRYIIKLRNNARSCPGDFQDKYGEEVVDTPLNLGSLSAFAGQFTSDHLQAFDKHHDVESITPDTYFRMTAGGLTVNDIRKQVNPEYQGLVRISHRHADGYKDFIFPRQAGSGVTVFVLDTGVQSDVEDFGNRVQFGISTLAPPNSTTDGDDPYYDDPMQDLNGHGTNVASLIAGRVFGVAKLATIASIKVLYFSEIGPLSAVLQGIEYAIQTALELSGPSLMNLSLTQQSRNELFDLATEGIPIPMITAAGNGYVVPQINSTPSTTIPIDACTVTPAGSPGFFAVGAIDNRDYPAPFSNYGRCVKLYAPGVDSFGDIPFIPTTGVNPFQAFLSGTSQATAVTSGVAALYMGLCPKVIRDNLYFALVKYATYGMVGQIQAGTPNRIVYNIPGSDYFEWCSFQNSENIPGWTAPEELEPIGGEVLQRPPEILEPI